MTMANLYEIRSRFIFSRPCRGDQSPTALSKARHYKAWHDSVPINPSPCLLETLIRYSQVMKCQNYAKRLATVMSCTYFS